MIEALVLSPDEFIPGDVIIWENHFVKMVEERKSPNNHIICWNCLIYFEKFEEDDQKECGCYLEEMYFQRQTKQLVIREVSD